jgi:uncharacterized protein YaiL (DUF2058 family)
MSNPFQEQFLKAGLVDGNRVKKAKAEKRKQVKQRKPDTEAAQAKRAAEKAAAQKAERDRRLNEQRREEAAKRELAAQIRQLIQENRQNRDNGDTPYNFVDGKKVRRIHITAKQQKQLTDGALAVVKLEGRYDLVPTEVAEKIKSRNERCVVVLNEPAAREAGEEDDPYAQYKVPDDLMW